MLVEMIRMRLIVRGYFVSESEYGVICIGQFFNIILVKEGILIEIVFKQIGVVIY